MTFQCIDCDLIVTIHADAGKDYCFESTTREAQEEMRIGCGWTFLPRPRCLDCSKDRKEEEDRGCPYTDILKRTGCEFCCHQSLCVTHGHDACYCDAEARHKGAWCPFGSVPQRMTDCGYCLNVCRTHGMEACDCNAAQRHKQPQ